MIKKISLSYTLHYFLKYMYVHVCACACVCTYACVHVNASVCACCACVCSRGHRPIRCRDILILVAFLKNTFPVKIIGQ